MHLMVDEDEDEDEDIGQMNSLIKKNLNQNPSILEKDSSFHEKIFPSRKTTRNIRLMEIRMITWLTGRINAGESLYELRRVWDKESSLSFRRDRAPRIGCVIKAKWWWGLNKSLETLAWDEDNIKSSVSSSSSSSPSSLSESEVIIQIDPVKLSNEIFVILGSK